MEISAKKIEKQTRDFEIKREKMVRTIPQKSLIQPLFQNQKKSLNEKEMEILKEETPPTSISILDEILHFSMENEEKRDELCKEYVRQIQELFDFQIQTMKLEEQAKSLNSAIILDVSQIHSQISNIISRNHDETEASSNIEIKKKILATKKLNSEILKEIEKMKEISTESQIDAEKEKNTLEILKGEIESIKKDIERNISKQLKDFQAYSKEVKILKEHLHLIERKIRCIVVVTERKIKGNLFDFENYFTLNPNNSKNASILLCASDKLFSKSLEEENEKTSRFKKQTPKAFSNSALKVDKILDFSNMNESFINNSCKLFTEIDLVLKATFYKQYQHLIKTLNINSNLHDILFFPSLMKGEKLDIYEKPMLEKVKDGVSLESNFHVTFFNLANTFDNGNQKQRTH